MPILRIDVIEGGSEAELKGLLNAIHHCQCDEHDLPVACLSNSNSCNLQNRPGAKCTPFTRPYLAFPCRTRSPGGGESFARFATRDRCYEVVFAR